MTGWANSPMTHDMITATPWSSMNLHMNQLYDHGLAMQNMYMYPQYNFNFMPYGNSCNPYLTDPMFAAYQTTYNPTTCYAANPWSQFGWNGSFGFGGGYTGGGGSTLTAEEEGFKRKYNTLLSLCRQLKNYDGLTNDKKDILSVAVRNSKGTWEEKYKALSEAYNKISKDDVREFLVDGAGKLGVSTDVKENAKNEDTFYNRLLAAGYEYQDTDIDSELNDFYSGIKNLKDSDGNDSTVTGIIDKIEIGEYNILDFVSSWNTKYKSDSKAKRPLDHILKYYTDIKDSNQKETARDKIVKPFAMALVKEANDLIDVLSDSSETKMQAAIDKLETEANKSDISTTELKKAFDDLYLYCRQAALVQIRNDARGYYGEVDSEVFNSDLFQDAMMKDLDAEGFTVNEIKNHAVTISTKKAKQNGSSGSSNGSSSSDPLGNIDNYGSSTDKINLLKGKGYLRETALKWNDNNKEYMIYKELDDNMTGDSNGDGTADYARLFYINADGKICEIINTKIKGDNTGTEKANSNSADAQVGQPIKASKILEYRTNVETAKAEEEAAAEETATAEEEINGYRRIGRKIYNALEGGTAKEEEKIIAEQLALITEENALYVLEEYYTKTNKGTNHNGPKGFIEWIDADSTTDNVPTATVNTALNNIVKCFENNKYAKNNPTIKTYIENLKETIMAWEDDLYDYTGNYKEFTSDLGKYTDEFDEVIDSWIHKIYEAIKAEEANEKNNKS